MPEKVVEHLGEGEVVEKVLNLRKRFSLKDYRIYASNLQLIIEKNNRITTIPFERIINITLKNERRTLLIVLGILHSLAGGLIYWIRGEGYALLMIPAGIFIISSGFFRIQHIELIISGWAKPLKIKGQSEKLDLLLGLIKKRTQKLNIGFR
ncbi:hypothetical protein ACFLYB_05515 [Chloroflexota bacterium]